MKKILLSVAVAVYNEEKNIGTCLASVSGLADEIVVVDGGSADATVSKVRKFTSHIIETDNPPIFHINKQKALDACRGEWILQLDADETVTEHLSREIRTIINSPESLNGYYIPRRNYFWGHFMKKGGQYPDAVIRLIRRGKAHFPCKSVHEQIEVNGKTGTLVHPMNHFTYRTRADYWKKADTYTTLTATELSQSGVNSGILFFRFCVSKPLVTFLSLFLRHKGFVDGLTGFEFALYSALHFPWAFYKFLKVHTA
jgi:glycosyltransferase involved in cell wall biosynthesis